MPLVAQSQPTLSWLLRLATAFAHFATARAGCSLNCLAPKQ
jgi:hypothetical protein